MGRPLRVAMVVHDTTARVEKEALALLNNGCLVDLICKSYGSCPDMWVTVSLWRNDIQLRQCMRQSDADIFHVHNQPDQLISLIAKDYRPVVVDVHDLYSILTGEVKQFERDLYLLGDGFVHVSEPMREHFTRIHGNGKPDVTVENYIPQALIEERTKWIGANPDPYPGPKVHPIPVVYEGNVCGDGNDPAVDRMAFSYYDFRDTAREMTEAGVGFHIYPARNSEAKEAHEKSGTKWHEGVSVVKLVREELGKYRWGFIGNANKYKQWDISMPNKLFEYMAAGIPVIVWNADTPAKFVREHGVGIVIDSPKDIVDRNEEAEACRKRAMETVQSFTWEKHVYKLERLYRKASLVASA